MKLKQYLFSQLAHTFFPIFLGLYFITSIVFLVNIASLTSVITLNFYELIKLYVYVVPTILFYTLPVTFFLSLGITLSKLSNEYELIVITSLGLNPMKILKVFLPITFILSVVLVVISAGLIPKAKYLNQTFLEQKKKEANFNIKSSEFGQKFGDWLIYISDKNDKTYKDVKLFKTLNEQDQFIIADSAVLNNEKGELNFKLFNGKSFHIQENEFNQIDYKNMILNESLKNEGAEYTFVDSYSFWKYYLTNSTIVTDEFAFYILLSLFPVLSLWLVISFGYFNPRYEKSKSISYSVIAVIIYYLLISILTDKFLLHSLYLVPAIWLISSYLIYRRTTKLKY